MVSFLPVATASIHRSRHPPMKNAFLSAALLATATTAASADGFYWQHIDPDPRPFAFGAMFTSDTEFEGYGVSDVVEGFFESNFIPIEDFLFGELELGVWAHAYGFVDNPNMKAVPHALLDASFNAGYVLRFDNGWAWRLWARPGVYSDPSAPAFGCPAGLSFFFTATDELSFEIGGTVRPGWDVPVIPNVGLKFRPSDVFELELGCPRSHVTLFPDHIVSFFATAEWRNTTYMLDDDDKHMPDKLTMDDILATAGVTLRLFGAIDLTGEFGTFLEREISADVEKDKGVDLSKDSFVRVTVGGAF